MSLQFFCTLKILGHFQALNYFLVFKRQDKALFFSCYVTSITKKQSVLENLHLLFNLQRLHCGNVLSTITSSCFLHSQLQQCMYVDITRATRLSKQIHIPHTITKRQLIFIYCLLIFFCIFKLSLLTFAGTFNIVTEKCSFEIK